MGEYLIQAVDLEWRDGAESTIIDCMADYGAFTLVIQKDGEIRVVGPATNGESSSWQGRVQLAISREYHRLDDTDIETLRQAAVVLARDTIGRIIKAAPHGDLAPMLKAEGVAVVDCRDLERLERGWVELQSMYEGKGAPEVTELKKQLAESQKLVEDLKSRVELNNLAGQSTWKFREGVKDALRPVGRQPEYMSDAELLARAVAAGESHALMLGLLDDLGIKVEQPELSATKASASVAAIPSGVAEGVAKAKSAILAGRIERARAIDELHRMEAEINDRADAAAFDAEREMATIAEHVNIRNALAKSLASLAASLVVEPFELTVDACHGVECK